jgi:hypothetical protein
MPIDFRGGFVGGHWADLTSKQEKSLVEETKPLARAQKRAATVKLRPLEPLRRPRGDGVSALRTAAQRSPSSLVPLKMQREIHRIGAVKWSPRKQSSRWPEGIPGHGSGRVRLAPRDQARRLAAHGHRDGASVRVITRGG